MAERKIVEPGTPLAYSEEVLPGTGTYDDGTQIRAAVFGTEHMDSTGISPEGGPGEHEPGTPPPEEGAPDDHGPGEPGPVNPSPDNKGDNPAPPGI